MLEIYVVYPYLVHAPVGQGQRGRPVLWRPRGGRVASCLGQSARQSSNRDCEELVVQLLVPLLKLSHRFPAHQEPPRNIPQRLLVFWCLHPVILADRSAGLRPGVILRCPASLPTLIKCQFYSAYRASTAGMDVKVVVPKIGGVNCWRN